MIIILNKKFFLMGITLLIILSAAIIQFRGDNVQESITYFPIDPRVTFQSANTSLTLLDSTKSDSYTLQWRFASTLDKKAYLRQDVGLLFSNGKLIGKLGNWKENTAQIKQEKKVMNKNSSFFQALTFHHAELHEKESQIFSAQTMSADQLYVVHSPFSSLISFRTAVSKEEKEWKGVLDHKIRSLLNKSWSKGIETFSINLSHYHTYPLTQFYFTSNDVIPGFSKEESKRVIGNLWEGLYKNYFLGIKKADGTIVNPIDSTIPLILLAKDKTHLLVLTETSDGEPILLRQKIEYTH